MGALIPMRQPLPDRRRSWTQKVKIGGQTCYLTVGEYDDGRPGEIFFDVARAGTFIRGVMGDLARTISLALQCGAPVDTVIYMLRGADYPPCGIVEGSPNVKSAESITDWIASELEAVYVTKSCVTMESLGFYRNGHTPEALGLNRDESAAGVQDSSDIPT